MGFIDSDKKLNGIRYIIDLCHVTPERPCLISFMRFKIFAGYAVKVSRRNVQQGMRLF